MDQDLVRAGSFLDRSDLMAMQIAELSAGVFSGPFIEWLAAPWDELRQVALPLAVNILIWMGKATDYQ